jgi:hypothetical protein
VERWGSGRGRTSGKGIGRVEAEAAIYRRYKITEGGLNIGGICVVRVMENQNEAYFTG